MPRAEIWATPKAALKYLLETPLQFGNDTQIQCVKVLQNAEALIGTVRECSECDGDGETGGICDQCGAECSECSDKPCETCGGQGETAWRRDEVYRLDGETIVRILAQPEAIARILAQPEERVA